MKKIIVLFSALLLSLTLSAQEKPKTKLLKNKKETFEVKGNCEMCKARIEKAALTVKGVKYALWDIPTDQITIIRDENKCSQMDVQKAIAGVGHDTKEVKANDEVYKNLAFCCQYRDGNGKHSDHKNH